MKEYCAKILSEEKYRLDESPCFDTRYQRLSWVDMWRKTENRSFAQYINWKNAG